MKQVMAALIGAALLVGAAAFAAESRALSKKEVKELLV